MNRQGAKTVPLGALGALAVTCLPGLAAAGGGVDEGLEEGELVGVVVGHAFGVQLDGQEEGVVWLGRGSGGLTY